MSLNKPVLRLELDWKSGQKSSLPACHLPTVILGNNFLPLSSFIPCLNPSYIYLELDCFSVGTVLDQIHTDHLAKWDLHLDGDHWMPLRFRSVVTARETLLPPSFHLLLLQKQVNQQTLNQAK